MNVTRNYISSLKAVRIIIGIFLLFVCASCNITGDIDVQNDPTNSSSSTVYLSVTRAQQAGVASINSDGTDYEDRVHDFGMLVFDSSTGEKVCEYYHENIPSTNTSETFTVKMKPGQRNFYFVANMSINDLKGITSDQEMEDYLNAGNNLDADLYLGANENKGFPMSRVYKNQSITAGSDPSVPIAFNPEGDGKIKLIRAVAKLEVQILNADFNANISHIYYRNAYRKFSLQSATPPSSPDYYTDQPMKKTGDRYLYYMPEALMANPSWGNTNHKPINYFVIETTYGDSYEVPIISDETIISGKDYLYYATGQSGVTPDYSVKRNKQYVFMINKSLEIYYKAEPWTTEQFQTYLGYGYTVQVDEKGKVTVYNTVGACNPHVVMLKTMGSFTFNDGATQKTFDTLTSGASAEYQLNAIPTSGVGEYLRIEYNGVVVKKFYK